MNQLTELFPGLEKIPVIGILRGLTLDEAELAAKLATDAGIPLMEVTVDSETSFDQLKLLTSMGITVGAGSVLTIDESERATSAGAAFIVSPAVLPAVIQSCVGASIPCIPGAATPTEIMAARNLGANAVKVFPANLLGGPSYLRAIRGPLHDPPLIPTGGVGLDDAADYLRAGAVAIGIGSSLFDAAGHVHELERRLGILIDSLHR